MTTDQSLMDLGAHCSVCRQLDFLPFTCPHCQLTLCAAHQKVDAHHCDHNPFTQERPLSPPTNLPSTKTLFPDRSRHKEALDAEMARLQANPKPTSLATTKSSAMDWVRKRLAKAQPMFTGTGRAGVKVGTAGASVSTAKALTALRRDAKGDSRVVPADRIHVWALFVSDVELDALAETLPVWISKKWPVGRALDVLAAALRVKNVNNVAEAQAQRLGICRLLRKGEKPGGTGSTPDELMAVNTSGRCEKEFREGDTVYLVRGNAQTLS